jgi:tubulin monoglycylase TTLL3/8
LKHRAIKRERLRDYQIVNHFQRNGELSTKVGLMHNIKNLVWFNESEIDRFFPVAYDLADVEVGDFIEEFKAIKAEATLKSFVERNLSLKDAGPIKVTLAIAITERRLKKLCDIICEPLLENSLVSNEEWEVLISHKMVEAKLLRINSFIKVEFPALKIRLEKMYSYYRKQYPQASSDDEALLNKAKDLLEELKKRFPQYAMNGTKNIWIVKPAGLSRGRGSQMFSDLKKLQDFIRGKHYIVQKYIENPLIILDRKFDIRQWVLVTSWNPLRVWIYKEMYIRFGAEDYNVDRIGNKFIHLTNNSIGKHLKKEYKIKGNMWQQDEFISYLKDTYKTDVWTEKIKSKVHNIIVESIKATSDVVIHRSNAFELFGYDVMIDEELNPWLIEVNCSPALDYSTVVCLSKGNRK